MRKFWVAFAAAIVAAGLGVGIAWAAAGATTGTNVACATATATTPARTITVSGMGGLTPTIAGASQTAAHCVTQTYTVPTNTVTTPGSTATKTVTVSATPTSSTSSSTPTSSTSTSSSSSTSASTSTTTSSTTASDPPPSGAIVGIAANPTVSCTVTATTPATASSDLASAAAGSTVCLKAGTTFGDLEIATADTKAVTLDGQGDTVGNIDIAAQISNLTLQGMNAQSFYLGDPGSNITIQYNTVSHVQAGDAIVLDSDAHGQSGSITGTTIRYNQIDHVGECLGDTYAQGNTTFTHNVCGPGLGYGDNASTDPGHYIQTGGENNMVVTNNAFIGPADPDAASSGIHLNVFHDWGNTNGLTFSNNLLWHDNAIGQAMLLQTGQFQNVQIKNNVAVEQLNDPSEAYTFWVDTAHGLTFSNNTTVDSAYGNLVTIAQTSGDYPSDTSAVAADNLTTGTWDNADCNFASDVTLTADYSGDSSCSAQFNGQWQNTSYTPSLPYSAPPAGWYQPKSLPGVGYQGSVGP
jgi:hypothetical protein